MSHTIKDIAKDTGLSQATISKYLNGKSISPENRLRIESSIHKLGYVPNHIARTLRNCKTNTICILLPVISDYFWGSLCGNIMEFMQMSRYYTIISSYDPFQKDQTEVYNRLLSAQVDGVILIPQNVEQMNLAALLKSGGLPFVCLDQIVLGQESDAVTSNNRISAYSATCYLLERGHRTLGVIGGDLNSYTNAERVRGFQQACKEYQILPDRQFILGGDFTSESGALLFRRMMTAQERPTAVLMLGYFLTVAAIQELEELKISVPEDVSLITFDDDQIFVAFEPPITAIVQDLREIGRRVTDLLLRRIQGDKSGYPEIQIVDTHFIERRSVKFMAELPRP